MLVRDLLIIKGINKYIINNQTCSKYHASQVFGTHEVVGVEVITKYRSLFKEDVRITIDEEDLIDPEKIVTPEIDYPETSQYVEVELSIVCKEK